MTEIDLRPFGFANGSYMGKCVSCSKSFMGDKRASNCAHCAYDAYQVKQAQNTRPAAPVEGLETVGATYMGYFYKVSGKAVWPVNAEELVTRSQAEAVIAAERNRAEVAEYKLDKAVNTVQPMIIQRAERAEADNAALTARVKELEADVSAYILSAEDQDKRRKALETQLAAARSALTDIASLTQTTDLLWWQKHARAALEAKP